MRRSIQSLFGLLLGLSVGLPMWVQPLEAQAGRDFLFGRPKVTLALGFGYDVARAGSDLFDEYLFSDFTLSRADFDAPVVAGNLAVFLDERVDLALELAYARSSSWSEYRDWVDQDDLPIEQQTQLTRLAFTVTGRYFLKDRGRAVSRFGWIPAHWSPYVGAGVGRLYYELKQVGDFVNFDDLSIFGDELFSDGSAWVAQLVGGAQVTLTPHFVLSGEARYRWAKADLDREYFRGFRPIDLSGFQAMAGIGVRF